MIYQKQKTIHSSLIYVMSTNQQADIEQSAVLQ